MLWKNMAEIVLVIHKHSPGYSVYLSIKEHIKCSQILMTLRMALFPPLRKSECSPMEILMRK